MMQSPKISIITPSFNQGQFIEETILSVIGQQYENLEYIVIDGGSSDDTIEIIKKYEKSIHFWVSEKDNGQSEAINKGFAKATGDIVMWLNSDDLLMPGILNKLKGLLHNESPFLWFGNCILFSEKFGVNTSGTNVVNNHNVLSLKDCDYIIQPSSLWNRKALEIVGGVNDKLYYTMDWDWYLRAQRKGIKFYPVEYCISMYRIHEAHKSSNGGNKRQDEIAAIYHEFNPLKESLYNILRNEKMLVSKNWLLRLTIKLLKKRNIYAKELVLKVLKYNKYKNFSILEIHSVSCML